VSIADLFAEDTSKMLTRLQVKFLRYLRTKSYKSVSVSFFGAPRIQEMLTAFGFKKVETDNRIVVYAQESFTYLDVIQNADNWYLTEGDNDV
jgi:hypothetical protein